MRIKQQLWRLRSTGSTGCLNRGLEGSAAGDGEKSVKTSK